MIDRATVAAVAREPGLPWDTAIAIAIAIEATQAIVAADTTRLDGVKVIGVDEHRWSHTRRPGDDGYVTVIVDLTPVLDGTERARLLDLAPGRCAAALTTWLADQSPAFRHQVEIVAMDGFTGYKNAATDQLPEATPVMDPYLCRGSDYADVWRVGAGHGGDGAGEGGIIRLGSRWFLHDKGGTRWCTSTAFTIQIGFGSSARWRRWLAN